MKPTASASISKKKNGLRAFMVCVDYLDIAAITLPYNAHHFAEINIVTTHHDFNKVKDLVWNMPNPTGTGFTVLGTDLFYANGASFNKWLALEWALDQLGREGWLCLMDADVLWPTSLKVWECGVNLCWDKLGCPSVTQEPGQLFTPLRRMLADFGKATFHHDMSLELYPPEDDWGKYPIHRNVREWAGYSQVFHSGDPHLGPAPWHEVDWKHAGGADSFFQVKWSASFKVRPRGWEVLHLGPAGMNWLGRSTPYVDGTQHPQAAERQEAIGHLWRNRRRREAIVRAEGLKGEAYKQQVFAPEKVKGLRLDTYQEEP